MSLNSSNSKMITVRNRGYVTTSRGRIMGPIRTPYREAIDRIWSMMLEERAEVYERLNDGSDLKLTPQNYDTDNNEPVTTPPIPDLPPVGGETSKSEPGVAKAPELPATKEVAPEKEESTEETAKVETPVETPEVKPETTEETVEDTTEETTPAEETKTEETATTEEVPAEAETEVVEEKVDEDTSDEADDASEEEESTEETSETEEKKTNNKNNKRNRRGKNKKQAEPTPEEKKENSAALEVPVDEA